MQYVYTDAIFRPLGSTQRSSLETELSRLPFIHPYKSLSPHVFLADDLQSLSFLRNKDEKKHVQMKNEETEPG